MWHKLVLPSVASDFRIFVITWDTLLYRLFTAAANKSLPSEEINTPCWNRNLSTDDPPFSVKISPNPTRQLNRHSSFLFRTSPLLCHQQSVFESPLEEYHTPRSLLTIAKNVWDTISFWLGFIHSQLRETVHWVKLFFFKVDCSCTLCDPLSKITIDGQCVSHSLFAWSTLMYHFVYF